MVADYSHWINVAETNAQDAVLTETINSVAPQIHHIHARIGYDHGPQVPDPRDPRWKDVTPRMRSFDTLIFTCMRMPS